MDFFSDIEKLIPVVEKYSPVLASSLGGPWGAIIGSALSLAFGTNDPTNLHNVLNSDPECKIKIAAIEAEVTKAMQEQNEKDQLSARTLDETLANTRNYWVIPFLTVIYTLSFVIYVFLIALHILDIDSSLITTLSMIAITIIHHFFSKDGNKHNSKG